MINSYKLYEVYYYSLYELGGEILTIEEVCILRLNSAFFSEIQST